jgi:hypothetical protein
VPPGNALWGSSPLCFEPTSCTWAGGTTAGTLDVCDHLRPEGWRSSSRWEPISPAEDEPWSTICSLPGATAPHLHRSRSSELPVSIH